MGYKGKLLPRELKNAIRTDFLTSDLSTQEIARKYQLHPNTILNHRDRENWIDTKTIIDYYKVLAKGAQMTKLTDLEKTNLILE